MPKITFQNPLKLKVVEPRFSVATKAEQQNRAVH
jgi:hypothetical protein